MLHLDDLTIQKKIRARCIFRIINLYKMILMEKITIKSPGKILEKDYYS